MHSEYELNTRALSGDDSRVIIKVQRFYKNFVSLSQNHTKMDRDIEKHYSLFCTSRKGPQKTCGHVSEDDR